MPSALFVLLALQVVGLTSSMEKAQLLYSNNLLREAKIELISVSTDRSSSEVDKAKALLLLGDISDQEGNSALAERTWDELIARFPRSEQASYAKQRKSQIRSQVSPRSPGNEAQQVAGPLPKSSLRLLKYGGEPRTLIRFIATEGVSQNSALRTRMAFTKTCEKNSHPLPDSPSPKGEMIIGFTVDSLKPISNDVFTYRQTVRFPKDSTSTSAGPDAISGQTVMQSNGRIVSTKWDGPLDKTSAASTPASGGVEFPIEPIGVGAVWTVPFSWETDGMPLHGTSTYTVQSIENNVVTVSAATVIPGGNFLAPDGSKGFVSARGQSAYVIYTAYPVPVSAFVDLGIFMRSMDGTSSPRRKDSGCLKMQMMVGESEFPRDWP